MYRSDLVPLHIDSVLVPSVQYIAELLLLIVYLFIVLLLLLLFIFIFILRGVIIFNIIDYFVFIFLLCIVGMGL